MNHYITQLRTPDPHQPGELATYEGPRIVADSWNDAEQQCRDRGQEYLRVTGQLHINRTCILLSKQEVANIQAIS